MVYAAAAHTAIGQYRKYTDEDYIRHPATVSRMVSNIPDVTEEMIAAAWLHDVVEDTHVSLGHIKSMFGLEVRDLVSDLTDVSKPSDGNRAVRKEIDRQHLAKASAQAKTIKLADLINNSESIIRCDPKFAKVFMAEKKLLLEVLTEGDSVLYAKAEQIVNDYYKGI